MIAPSGRLAPERLGRILTDLLSHRYTGVLSASDGESSKEFYFAGSGVKCSSTGPRKSQPIGRFWVAQGFVADDALSEALQRQHEKAGGLLGEHCIEMGLLTEEQRDAGLVDQLVEELSDLYFWPGAKYHYRPGHQTRVGTVDGMKPLTGVKSLSVKTNLAQALMRARVDGQNLREAGRALGGIETEYRTTAAAKDVLFTRAVFLELPGPRRALLPLLTRPVNAGQLIEGSGLPWSHVLGGMHDFLKKGWIERAGP